MKQKIIPNSLPPEFKDDTEFIGIDNMQITYTQPADTNSNKDEVQFLTISTSDTIGTDDEDMNYFFRIKTDRWSIDGEKDLEMLIKDFKKRLKVVTERDCDESK
jgi:hypothetical protein